MIVRNYWPKPTKQNNINKQKNKTKWLCKLKLQSCELVIWTKYWLRVLFCVLIHYENKLYFLALCSLSFYLTAIIPLQLWQQEIEFHFWLIAFLFLFALIIVPGHLQKSNTICNDAFVQQSCFLYPHSSLSQCLPHILYIFYFLLSCLSGILFCLIILMITNVENEWIWTYMPSMHS